MKVGTDIFLIIIITGAQLIVKTWPPLVISSIF